MEWNDQGTKKKKGIVAAAALLSGCLIASLGLNIYMTTQTSAQNQKVNKFIENQLERQAKEEELENEYQEDGYVVAESYEIRSTKQISDAYISGDDSGLSKEDKETLEMAKGILDKIIKEGMSDYKKERAVFRWMTKNLGHTSTVVTLPGANGEAYTPHDVLVSKSGVCVGYATTFRMFMQMLGMDCHIVHNESHSWDLVQLDDGEWYHVDIYFSIDGNKYENFNMTDAVARSSHSWDESGLPAAEGTKYIPAEIYKKEMKNIYQVPKKVKKALDKNKDAVFATFKEKLEKDELQIADVLLEQLNSAMSMSGVGDGYISGSWAIGADGEYILCVYITRYNATDVTESGLDEEKQQKLTDSINQAFGVDISNYDPYAGMTEEYGMTDVYYNTDVGATEEVNAMEDVTEMAEEDGE